MPEAYHIQALTTKEARDFCEQWLPAWTGNDPSRLASFYTDGLYYADPSIPAEFAGRRISSAIFRSC
jgi:hypothetical protein